MNKILYKNYIFIIVIAFIMSFSIGYFATNNGLNEEALSPDRAANFDKMKISYITMVERKTGVEPFDSESDENGHDASESDNYVRTNDSFSYRIEVGVALNLDNPDVTETTSLTGGVIKIRGTLPTGPNGEKVFAWAEQPWMRNISTTNNGSIINAEFIVEDDNTIVGGNQQLFFQIYTLNKNINFTDSNDNRRHSSKC